LLHSNLEGRKKFLANRAQLSPAELEVHASQWIAWSPDGTRIVAYADDLEVLDELVLQAVEDLERCVIEGIPEADVLLGDRSLERTRP